MRPFRPLLRPAAPTVPPCRFRLNRFRHSEDIDFKGGHADVQHRC